MGQTKKIEPTPAPDAKETAAPAGKTVPPSPPPVPAASADAVVEKKGRSPRVSQPGLASQDKVIVLFAVVGLAAAVYFLFFHNSMGFHHGAKQVGMLSSEGLVRRRYAGALSWANMEGKNPVYLRDILFIPAGTKAVLTLNGKSIVIPPDTMVQLDESTIDEIEIMLTDGVSAPVIPLQLRVKKFAVNSDVAALELRWGELKERTKLRLFTQLKLEPLLPLTSVPELALESIENYTLKILAPKPGERLDFKSGGWSKFSWTALPGKNIVYRVEISKQEDFAKVLAQETKSLSVIIRLTEVSPYFLRISAVKKGRVIATANSKFSLAKGKKAKEASE